MDIKGKGWKYSDSDGKRDTLETKKGLLLVSILGRQFRVSSDPGFSENCAACLVLDVLIRPIKLFLCLSAMLKIEPVAATSASTPQE